MIKKTRQLPIEGTRQRARFQEEEGAAQPPTQSANTLQTRKENRMKDLNRPLPASILVTALLAATTWGVL